IVSVRFLGRFLGGAAAVAAGRTIVTPAATVPILTKSRRLSRGGAFRIVMGFSVEFFGLRLCAAGKARLDSVAAPDPGNLAAQRRSLALLDTKAAGSVSRRFAVCQGRHQGPTDHPGIACPSSPFPSNESPVAPSPSQACPRQSRT